MPVRSYLPDEPSPAGIGGTNLPEVDMHFSVVVPAHNEESFLPKCLGALNAASRNLDQPLEIIVVLNRCTDGTEAIARNFGAKIVVEDRRSLPAIRNAGAAVASGDVLVTVDSDSLVSENVFTEIARKIESGRYVGGGITVLPERKSLGIRATWALLRISLWITGLSGGLYWCRLEDFRAVGGFDERLGFGEDIDFAKRLRAHGRKTARRFTCLTSAFIVTSCRKFDRFGDWYFFKVALTRSKEVRDGMKGRSTTFQDRYFYDFNSTGQG